MLAKRPAKEKRIIRYDNEYHGEGRIFRLSPLVISRDGMDIAGATIYFDNLPILLYLINWDGRAPSGADIMDKSQADRRQSG